MSVKDLFRVNVPTQLISAESSETLGSNAESATNVENKLKRSQVYLPPVDFSSASNFAVYGSAEKYYEDAVKRVYLEYPYDGSEAEINEYILSSSYLDQYVFDERYPRTNGYIILAANGWGTQIASTGSYGAPASSSYEYISLKGGPNTNLSEASRASAAFTGSNNQNNVLDLAKNRGNNLALNPASGSTVEFWLKKSEFVTSLTEKEVIFDVWNNNATTSDAYGRLMVELSGAVASVSPFRITYTSGTSGFANHRIGLLTAADVADDEWHHYAITFASSSTALTAKLYIDGDLNDTQTTSSTINEVTGALVANIGALRTSPTGSTYATQGWGKLSGSLDEFRYWKTERTAEDIGRNFFTQVRGGTNTDDANTDLGVYYKFNEGITDNSSNDSVVLDYSGRISNGAWTGYNTNARNTGSAMVSSSAALAEFRDPIIYSDHPQVAALLSELRQSGSTHDTENNASIYGSLPSWITEADSSGDLKNLVQVMASYFDRLQSQIKEVPRLKNLQYQSSSNQPAPFANNLVNSTGMTSPDIFIDANIMELILSRDENRDFNLDIDEVKGRIYQNIYNNLIYINKSKGTEKAFRNLIHCYGIDEQLIRLNTYGNNVTYELRDNFRSTAVAKNLANFNTTASFDATVYQYADPSNSNSVSFISGSDSGLESYVGFTFEGEVIFPVPIDPCSENSFSSDFVTCSIMGMHAADGTVPTDTTIPTPDVADLRIIAVRPDIDSTDAYFKLTSSIAQISPITTDTYKDVFNNNKWNFAARIINEKYPFGDTITGVAGDNYRVEFYGINSELDVVRDEFFLTSSVKVASAATNFLQSDKRIFAGAHRDNFTGSVLQQSNVKLSSVRYWADYVPNAVIAAHARDTENNGTLNPHRNAFLTQAALTGTYIPEIETLALNWGFYDVTGSDSSGQFIVNDLSSGSTEQQTRYGWYGNVVKAQHTGRGDFFATNDNQAIDRDYIYAARQVAPEVIQSSEMIRILDSDDENFTRDQRPVNFFLAIEKSMYQVISDEMINTFATILEFNNLIGDPVNRYRQDYKLMEKARNLFFEKVENTPDLDKFIDFYKWIDASLSTFLRQLLPSSAASSEGVINVVESHILERNKYWTKFPTIERKSPTLTGSAPTIIRSSFAQTAPIGLTQNKNQTYWLQRASRKDSPLATGIAGVDDSKENILKALQSDYNRQKPYKLEVKTDQEKASPRRSIHGGTNYPPSKDRDITYISTYPQGPQAASGTPLNVMLIDNVDVTQFQNVTGTLPEEKDKKFYSFKVSLRRDQEIGSPTDGRDGYAGIMKGALAAPFNLVSSSIDTGYGNLIVNNFASGTELVNLHSDTISPSNEIPMQGPFTQRHVGGRQVRHASINRYVSTSTTTNKIDDKATRAEAWRILVGTQYGSDDTFIGLVEAQYPFPTGPYPETARRKAIYYREERAKRPVNIRNIKYTTASADLGNYDQNYQIVQTVGRTLNNKYFVENEGVTLPSSPINLNTTLKQTNTLSTLLGLKHPSTVGNIFGVKPDPTDPTILDPSARYELLASTAVADRTSSADKSIIVNRFSAPGGPEVSSLGYLDIIAAEKSVYNAMPFRNLSVLSSGSGEDGTIRVVDQLDRRRGLRTLRALHAGQFGHDATYGSVTSNTYITQPSYHKENRNTYRVIRFSGDTGYADNSYVSASIFDNINVTNAIPRSDLQYAWITASYTQSRIVGHAWGDSVVSSSVDGFQQAISFATASDWSIETDTPSGDPRNRVDFAGTNLLIIDPVDLSNNILSSSNNEYRNNLIADPGVEEIAPHLVLNGLILHRGGPYGFNSWKQTRSGRHPVARALRERNIISYVPKTNYNYPLNVVSSSASPLYGNISHFTESVVVSKYKPLEQELAVRALDSKGNITTEDTLFASSYANNRAAFNNVLLNNLYNVNPNKEQPYDQLKNLYLDGAAADPDSPVEEFVSLTYRESVYPAVINAYSSSVRVRQNYANNFWRNLRSDRTQTDLTKVKGFDLPDNVLITSQSMWSLDAEEDFLTARITANTGTGSAGPGVLLARYNQFHSGTKANITASVQYSRIHTLDRPNSLLTIGGYSSSYVDGTSLASLNDTFRSIGATDQIYGGASLWQAGEQAGKTPWYNNYEDYVSQMRLVGKDYSIVPSFRISEHIDRYVKDLGGNFLADNDVFLEVTGGTGDRDKSDEELFYKTYTNSDFLKFFEVVRKDHENVGDPTSIALRCKALLKFIPYDGFYPSERTTQMGLQFSSSYGANVVLTGSDSSTSTSGALPDNVGFRTFMTPFFGPGIMYNSIKSGLAVDYPMFSASVELHDDTYKASTGATPLISGSGGIGRFHYRIPFEAMIEPENYIADKDMADMEPSPSCSLNVTASWSGLGDSRYKLMASNFFAEVPDFFLPERQFTSLVSRPESQFETVKQGEQYAARIKIFKSLNVPSYRTGALGYRNPMIPRDLKGEVFETFTMYSRPTAFGPPCGGGEAELVQTSTDGLNLPFTPPYYNGESWADLIFTAPRSSTTENPITLQEIFSPANLSVALRRVGNEWAVMKENTMYHSANVEYNAMQLDACLNMFGQAQIKDLKYDPATGKPIEASDTKQNVWVIQPKFETPMLNFSGSEFAAPQFGSASVGVGMWHQYGVLPEQPDQGIFLQIADIPRNYISKALGGDPGSTGSLTELVGFGTEPKRLGRIATGKTVCEAVVAIPYIVADGQKKFFDLERQRIDKALRIVNFGDVMGPEEEHCPGESIIRMVRSMQKFVLPPKMDFLANPENVTPFSMYIFEFEHTFDQDDLSDMWQNLPPKIGYSFDTDRGDYPPTAQAVKEVEIDHDLLYNELLAGNLEDKLQWMVFKVKQKAQKNYFDKVIKDSNQQVGNFDRSLGVQVGREDSSKVFDPKYSYNWPYDFFSLVELVNVEAEIDIEKTSE